MRFEREWLALRAYAAERDVRVIGDVPIYVAVDGCDHRAHPELFLPLDEVVAGAPPDDLNDLGQLWGNPLYDWHGDGRATATAGGSSGCAACSTSSTSSGSTTSAGSPGYWTVPGRRGDRAGRLVVAGAGPVALPRRRGGARAAAGDRRGPRRHHAGRPRAPRRARVPGMVVLLWSLSEADGQPAPTREPPRQPGRLHLDARHRHARRLHGRGPTSWPLRRARALVAVRARDRPRAGRARARERGAHEPSGRGRGGELAVAPRARRADGRTRRPPPGGRRSQRSSQARASRERRSLLWARCTTQLRPEAGFAGREVRSG